jgi:hypothetical protein
MWFGSGEFGKIDRSWDRDELKIYLGASRGIGFLLIGVGLDETVLFLCGAVEIDTADEGFFYSGALQKFWFLGSMKVLMGT